MKLKNLVILTGLTVTGILASGTLATTVHATTFSWSYTANDGVRFAGLFDGTIQPDGKTVDVTSAYNTTINGTLATATPYVYSVSSVFPPYPVSPPEVSLDGSVMDFAACTVSVCGEGFAFGNYPDNGGLGLVFAAAGSYGNYDESFVLSSWNLTSVPEPSSMLGTIAVLGLGATLKHRLANRKKEK